VETLFLSNELMSVDLRPQRVSDHEGRRFERQSFVRANEGPTLESSGLCGVNSILIDSCDKSKVGSCTKVRLSVFTLVCFISPTSLIFSLCFSACSNERQPYEARETTNVPSSR